MSSSITMAQLERSSSGWSIRYLSGPLHAETVALFGTAVLPLPFTAEASLRDVVLAMQGTPGVSLYGDGRMSIAPPLLTP
jgi:hypothetical protein